MKIDSNSEGSKDTDRLYDIAHARAGDKGDRSNIVVVPYDDADYEYIARTVTSERVKAHFGSLVSREVRRYSVPKLRCLNFVLDGALNGGVTTSSRLDRHGKTLSYHLLTLPLDLDAEVDTDG